MDPEFTKIMLRVALFGGAIFVIGAGTLALAFRSFNREQAFRPVLLIAVVLTFVFLVCAILLRMSLVR